MNKRWACGVKRWCAAVALGLGMALPAMADFAVYTSGQAPYASPEALPNLVSLSLDSGVVPVTGAGITTSSSLDSGWFCTGGTLTSQTASSSEPDFLSKYLRLLSGTCSSTGSTWTVNFSGGGTTYVSFLWNLAFSDDVEYHNLKFTITNGTTTSTVDIGNCPDRTSPNCVPYYASDSGNWLFSLIGNILAGIFDCGGPDTTGTVRVSYKPPAGYKVTKMDMLAKRNGAGLLCLSTRNNPSKIDQFSYVDGTVAPHHLEVSATSASGAANSAITFSIKACANASCSQLYTNGVTGSLVLSGTPSVTYSGGAAFSIPPGSSSTTKVATPSSAGGLSVSLSTVAIPFIPTAVASPTIYCGLGAAAASGNSCVFTATAALHHVELTASSNTAITCTPVTYTVKACGNAACSITFDSGLTGTLAVSGVTVNYPAGADFSIANGSSTTTVSAHLTTTGTATASLSGLSATPTNTPNVFCGMGVAAASGGSCAITMASSALYFNVPNHVSEVAQSVTISAVRSSDNAAVCTPAFANVSKDVKLKCSHSNPSTGTMPVRVNNTALNAGATTASACDATGQTLSLGFNASGVATVSVQYADVGLMGMTASYTGAGTDAGLSMTASDTFIVVPASFGIDVLTATPIKAGSDFSVKVTARNNGNTATPNFGKETAPESVRLSWAKYQPTGTGAVAGTFTGTGISPSAALGGFASGMATASDMKWTEVGSGDLSATLTSGSYLGSGLTVAGSSGGAGGVGPFMPHHFDVAVTQACSAAFTYSGQPFTATVTARNAAGAKTLNYDGSAATAPHFAKAVTLSAASNGGTGSFSNATGAVADFTSGVGTLSTAAFTFTNKLTAPTSVTVRATDTDGASSSGGTEGALALRSGRLRVSNAFGSEKQALLVPVQVQYWSGGAWVLNSADSCTSIPAAAVVRAGYLDHKGDTSTSWSTTPSAVTITGGNGILTLSAPSVSGSTGSVDFAFNLGSGGTDQSCLSSHPASTGANLSWLRGRNGSANSCNGVSTYDRDPSARATFGIYHPETKRAVHSRELF